MNTITTEVIIMHGTTDVVRLWRQLLNFLCVVLFSADRVARNAGLHGRIILRKP